MSNFKGKQEKGKKIDFNNAQDFQSIVNQTLNSKLANGKKNAGTTAISFLTRNGKPVAIIAGYCLASGIGLNIYWIIKLISLIF